MRRRDWHGQRQCQRDCADGQGGLAVGRVESHCRCADVRLGGRSEIKAAGIAAFNIVAVSSEGATARKPAQQGARAWPCRAAGQPGPGPRMPRGCCAGRRLHNPGPHSQFE